VHYKIGFKTGSKTGSKLDLHGDSTPPRHTSKLFQSTCITSDNLCISSNPEPATSANGRINHTGRLNLREQGLRMERLSSRSITQFASTGGHADGKHNCSVCWSCRVQGGKTSSQQGPPLWSGLLNRVRPKVLAISTPCRVHYDQKPTKVPSARWRAWDFR
jgi:hypothetical protein